MENIPIKDTSFKDPQKKIKWIQTYTSNKFHFSDEVDSMINIQDIAHPLSQIPRFSGHLKFPLSVAQHSVMVMALMEKDGYDNDILLEALMHDCHEAYIGDIATPMKNYLYDEFGFDFKEFEMNIRKRILDRFGIKDKNPLLIEKYDLIMCKSEAHCLFDKIVDKWTDSIPYRLNDRIKQILTPPMAKAVFIQQYKRLGGKL